VTKVLCTQADKFYFSKTWLAKDFCCCCCLWYVAI